MDWEREKKKEKISFIKRRIIYWSIDPTFTMPKVILCTQILLLLSLPCTVEMRMLLQIGNDLLADYLLYVLCKDVCLGLLSKSNYYPLECVFARVLSLLFVCCCWIESKCQKLLLIVEIRYLFILDWIQLRIHSTVFSIKSSYSKSHWCYHSDACAHAVELLHSAKSSIASRNWIRCGASIAWFKSAIIVVVLLLPVQFQCKRTCVIMVLIVRLIN